MTASLLASLGRYLPELIIVVTMMFLLYLEASYKKDENEKTFMYVVTAIGLVVGMIFLFNNLRLDPTGTFTNAVIIDPFSTFTKIIMIISALGTTYLCKISKDIYQEMKGEYLIMTVGILAGGMLLSSANNFLTIYLGIETLSILSYVMASFKKYEMRSSEAGLKYVLYGGVASGIMLFGISHIYGVFGTIQFAEMKSIFATEVASANLMILIPSFIMFFVGLGYKIACVPFHMWTPDVYEGSPLPVTTFFALVPKIAGIAVIVRVTHTFFGDVMATDSSHWWAFFLTIVSALTMTVGNVTAINQRSVKRMLAYSSISHAGVLLAGATVIGTLGTQSILFYLVAYVFMTLVSFYIVGIVSDKYGNDHFERFNGLINKHPFMAITLTLTMFSLAGIPPFSGFVAKFNIISALISANSYSLAVITVINSVISVYYYMRLARLMIFRPIESERPIEGFNFLNQLVIVGMGVPILVLGLFWETIVVMANGAQIYLK